jgi:hypothetical protein
MGPPQGSTPLIDLIPPLSDVVYPDSRLDEISARVTANSSNIQCDSEGEGVRIAKARCGCSQGSQPLKHWRVDRLKLKGRFGINRNGPFCSWKRLVQWRRATTRRVFDGSSLQNQALPFPRGPKC